MFKSLDEKGFEPMKKNQFDDSEEREKKKKKKKKKSLFEASEFQKELMKNAQSSPEKIGIATGTILGNIIRRKKSKKDGE